MKRIYFDNAATTMVDPLAAKEMLPFFSEKYGNPSSLHSMGSQAREAVENSRGVIAKTLSCSPAEIIFTSGGTESDNLAIRGSLFSKDGKIKMGAEGKGEIITTKIEHPAVLRTFEDLEKQGFKAHYLDVDRFGVFKLKQLESLLSKNTLLVSIMHANNEVGTIEPIREAGEIVKAKSNALFHVDAVQSYSKLPIDLKKLSSIDLLSLSAHKIHGPKGIGALFVRDGVSISPLLTGGHHENGLRSGTENVPGIVGFGKASELAFKNFDSNVSKMAKMRDSLVKEISQIEDALLVGHPSNRLCSNAAFCFAGLEGESILLRLDLEGVEVSTGSACSSRDLKASHVLLAMGFAPELAHGSIRFSLSRFSTPSEAKSAVDSTKRVVSQLRKLSPVSAREAKAGYSHCNP